MMRGDRVPSALIELITLGRTVKKRAADVLAYSTGPAPPTAPPKRSIAASSHLRGSALGFRNLTTTSPDRYTRLRLQTGLLPLL